MAKADTQMAKPPVTPGVQKRAKATVSSRYLIPLATAMLLGVCFVIYYLTYVQQHREYLLNRNYRVLATLGEQMSETLANQTATLASYINAFENNEFFETMDGRETVIRTSGMDDKPERKDLQKRGPSALTSERRSENFRMSEEIHTFAPRLNHVVIRQVALERDPVRPDPVSLNGKQAPANQPQQPINPNPAGLNGKQAHVNQSQQPINPDLVRRDGQWMFQLAAVDHDRDHEASATISVQDLALSFSPSIMDTFEDVLIADEDGRIIFQKQRIGPHFSYLSELVKGAAQSNNNEGQANKDDKVDSRGSPHDGSEQLVEVDLAGVPNLIFLEPVTIDLSPSYGEEKKQVRRFTLSGLVPSRGFRWQSLAISYQSVIWLSSVFLLLCLCAPIIKIFFLNERERLRLREIVLLPLLFAAIAGVLTSICLQTIYFNLGQDDTDEELKNVSRQMQDNIKSEIRAMREQLLDACRAEDLAEDLNYQEKHPPLQVIRRNVLKTEFLDADSHPVARYPYFNSLFFTDAKGRQVVKWTPMAHATPLIDVSGSEFFRSLDSDNHYFFLDESKPFRLDSLLPPNQDNYVGVLGMRLSDCPGTGADGTGFAFLSAPLLSLIDPKLPLGMSFALVDDTGRVLFHSDKHRNNRENILVETRNDGELTASLYGHSNVQNFSVNYRGGEVRARVVSVPGITQSPWSLIVYKDVLYGQTYDLEIITIAGTLLFGYLGAPALIVCLFYILAKPTYVPEWLWPSESAQVIYRFQIEAGMVMLVLSATLTFLRPIEESLYAAAAAGYLTLIIVFWSTLSSRSPARGKTVHWTCGLAALPIVAFPVWSQPRWWYVLAGLLLVPAALVLLRSRHFAAARWPFPNLQYRSLYNIRALVLLTVVAILPPLSFFRNSMLLEDILYIRAAQLDAAIAWNSRERMIEKLDKEVADPEISKLPVGPGLSGSAPVDRCRTVWDFYLSSYFGTEANRESHSAVQKPASDNLSDRFLRFAHLLHHSYNNIGAEALGVLRNRGLPENVFVPKSPPKVPGSSLAERVQESPPKVSGSSPAVQVKSDLSEWEWEWEWVPWEWVPRDSKCERSPKPLQLRLHEGADRTNPCAAPGDGQASALPRPDLVIKSRPPVGRVSLPSNVLTWLAVATVMGLLFWLVTRKVFLLDLREPLSHSPEELRKLLKSAGSVLVLPASRGDWSLDLAGRGALRIDVKELAAEADWGDKFDLAQLQPGNPVVIENFDWELGDPKSNRQRLILMERLVAHSNKVIAVSAVDPSPFMIDHCGCEGEGDASRWAAVLQAFTRINLGHRPSWALGAQIREELPAVWQECCVQPELQRVGEDLWHSRNQFQPIEREQLVAEVGERAAQYYYLEWRSCTQEECFLLTGLARDGMVNPRNTASLRQLLRRRLIVRDPQFRIMNESFRRFVLAQAGISMREAWEAEAAGSGWGKARGPFATALVLVGLFLLATQQQFLQTSAGMLTATGGCLAALLKLITVVQGRQSDN